VQSFLWSVLMGMLGARRCNLHGGKLLLTVVIGSYLYHPWFMEVRVVSQVVRV
jgi:hypothetical protein